MKQSEEEESIDNILLCCVGGSLLAKRPELFGLLQDTAVTIEEQMDSSDEALDELAEGLKEEEMEGCPDIPQDPLGKEDSQAIGNVATDGNDRLPMSYFTQCLEGDFTQLYFMQEHNDPNGRIRGIAYRAQYCLKRSSGLSTLNAAKYLFITLDILVSLARADQEKFVHHNLLNFELSRASPRVDGFKMPTNREEADRLCLRGVFSMFAQIPTEQDFEIDGHACISLIAKLKTAFAQGTHFLFMKDSSGVNSDGFNGTPRVAALLAELERNQENQEAKPAHYGHVMSWSDGYLGCFSRQRDNSYWIFVVRIMPPEGCSTSIKHTFCLAMGSSKECHDKVIAFYMKEVVELMKGMWFYYGKEGVKDKIYVCIGIAAYIADTLKRKGIEHSLNRGNYGKRSGHAGRVDTDVLPSCQHCFLRMVEELLLGEQASSS